MFALVTFTNLGYENLPIHSIYNGHYPWSGAKIDNGSKLQFNFVLL
jgi:hypothetical protein